MVYLICSLPMTDAQPETVAAWIRGHWGIENRLHWVRDVVFDEDHHQLRTRNGPEIIAALRNLATRPHPPDLRHQNRYRLNHQIPVQTPQTSHQPTNPTNPPNQLCRPPERLPITPTGGRQSRWVRVSELVSRGGVCWDDEWCLVNPFVLGARADVIFHHDRPVAPASGPGSQEHHRPPEQAGCAS